MKAVLTASACAVSVAALAQLATGSADPGPPPDLTIQPSGPAFAHGGGDGPPPLTVAGLSGGQATTGSVTVTNRGPAWRWVWLGQGRVQQRLGQTGGRLADALRLTVLDVTDVGSPATVYEGPATALGAQPLGFLAPGATRTYGFTAQLPVQPPPPVAGAADPLRGASAALHLDWRSVPGRPGAAVVARRRPQDRRPPRVRFVVARHQRLLQARTLRIGVRCSEPCRITTTAVAQAGAVRWHAPVRSGPGGSRGRTVRVRLTRRTVAVVRHAIVAGRPTVIRVRVRARDRHGNVAHATDTVRLRAGR